MVRNNIELDVKVKCVEQGVTQQTIAEKIGTTGQYVNRIVKKKDGIMNKTFVEIMEALGYDIEITYIPREK
jgi:transcriptional regulator with XRE-family HTH domain|nr:MAG TPA: Helix-turn-helix XRE-family like protein [Caudoviricetes sp.]